MNTPMRSGPNQFQIHEIWVNGAPRDIGRQHAEAVGKGIHEGMPRFYYEFWRRMSNPSTSGWMKRYGMVLVRRFLDDVILKKMRAQIPDWALQRVLGLCDVSGRNIDEMTTALILPDLLPLFEVWLNRWYPELFIRVRVPPLFGCSSFFARGKGFLFGRNLDFPGVGYWDRFPVIQVTEPQGALRYISFTSAGVPFGGITGINEAQISVALHQHYSGAGSLNGKLPFLIAEKILMEARSLAQAEKILREYRVATSWAFLIGDGKKSEAMIYETHSRASTVNRLQGSQLAHTNYFQTADCKKEEFATSDRMTWDNYCRKHRMEQLLKTEGEKLCPESGVKILGDHYDPYWDEEKPFNRTISQVYNIQSLLIDMDQMKVYMAEGNSPIHLREYVAFSLGDLFAGRSGRQPVSYAGYSFASQSKRAAKEQFILSFVKAFDGDLAEANTYLEASLAAEYLPEAALIYAILKLKSHRYEDALEHLSRARTFIENKKREKERVGFPPEYFEILVYLARTYDLLGKFNDADATYDEMLRSPSLRDENLRRIAKRRKRYAVKNLESILMPYSSYIPFP